jgi:hypothetical protein
VHDRERACDALRPSPSYRWEVPPLAALPERPQETTLRAFRRLAIEAA